MRRLFTLLAVIAIAAGLYFYLWPQGEKDTVVAMAEDTAMESDASATAVEDPMAVTEDDDPYIWLEDVLGDEALDWVRARNTETLDDLKADPRYEGFYEASLEVYTSEDRIVYGEPRDGFLYNFWQDQTHVRGIWRRSPLPAYVAGAPDWDVILDLDVLAEAEGENWVWDGANCFAGSTRCLIGMSHGGSDANFFREFNMETRTFVEGGFALGEAKQGIEWVTEDSVLVATDRGEGTMTTSGYPNTVVLWRRGGALEDAPVIFEGNLEDVGTFGSEYETPEGHQNVIVRAPSFFEFEHHYVGADGTLTLLPAPMRADFQGFHKGQVIFGLNEDWTIDTATGEQIFGSGSVISYGLSDLLDDGALQTVHTVFVPEARVAFQSAAPSGGALYLSLLDNVVGRVVRATFDGIWSTDDVALPGNGRVGIASTDDMEDRVFFNYENFLIPDSLYYAEAGGAPVVVQSMPEWFDAQGLVARQEIAVSADGERIPYFIVHRADMEFDGTTPTLLYGYGGFQISMGPLIPAMWGACGLPMEGPMRWPIFAAAASLVLLGIRQHFWKTASAPLMISLPLKNT